DIVIPMEMGIWKSKELDSRSTDCGNDRLHSFLKTQKTIPHRVMWKGYHKLSLFLQGCKCINFSTAIP
ncbi:MAG: hypothetical protein V3U58_06740, partial [Thermodesulfobacteriota bacterium]